MEFNGITQVVSVTAVISGIRVSASFFVSFV